MIYPNKNVKSIYRKMTIRKTTIYGIFFSFWGICFGPIFESCKNTTLCMLNCIQSRENSGGAAARQPTPKIGLCLDLQMGLAVNG